MGKFFLRLLKTQNQRGIDYLKMSAQFNVQLNKKQIKKLEKMFATHKTKLYNFVMESL